MDEDKALYKRFLNGEKNALNELILKYRTEIIYFIQNFTNDYHLAEDISQEVFVYLLQHREVYDFEYTFKTYLYTIAKSRALNYIKNRKKLEFIEDNQDKLFAEVKSVEDEVCQNDKDAMVRKAIKKLVKQYQLVIYLVDLRGFTYLEAGLIMGKSASQIKAMLFNARKRLKEVLERECKKKGGLGEITGYLH